MKKNQEGFGVVGIVALVVVVGLIGAVGWLVYDRQKNPQATESATPQDTQSDEVVKQEETPKEDDTANWLLYEAPDKIYTIRIADGWKLYHYSDEGSRNDLSSDYTKDTTYKEGVQATVDVRTQGGRGGLAYFGLFYNRDDNVCNTEGYVKQADLKTNDGLTVTKRLYTQKGDDIYFQDGDTSHSYEVSVAGKNVCIIYDELKGDVSKQDIVERVVKTLSFE